MKTMTVTGLLVAGLLLAAGSGVFGSDSGQEKTEGCCASKAGQASTCPRENGMMLVSTGSQEKEACSEGGSCCAAKGEAVMAKTTQEKASCGSCCSKDAKAATLVTTDATQEKACDGESCDAGGSCCADKAKAATLVTTEATQEKACDGKSCDAGGSCCADKGAATVSTDGDATEGVCPVTLAMSELPQLVYTVGEQRVCCEKMAGELAKKEGSEVHYVVAEKSFGEKAKAMAALADATETMVAAYTKPKTCEVSGNTTIAGKTCDCPVETAARTQAVEEAVAAVEMKYMVDGQEAACGNCAASRSKETGKPVEFVVAGQSTTCEVTARVNLARAKYKAAVEAVVALEKKTANQQ